MRLPDIEQENMTCQLPWQPYSNQTTANALVPINVHPASLAKHPRLWTKDEVGVWLRWCSEEFSIEPINPDKFDLNGKALCLLSRSDFLDRLPKNGDVLYNCLQSVMTKNSGSGLFYQPNLSFASTSAVETTQLYKDPVTSFPSLPRGLIFVPSPSVCQSTLACSNPSAPVRSYVPIKPYPTTLETASRVPSPITTTSVTAKPALTEVDEKPHIHQEFDKCLDENVSSTSFKDFLRYPYPTSISSPSPSFIDHKLEIPRHQRSSDCRLLWEFIYQLLLNTKYSGYVSWENKEDFVFRIVNPTGLAELWGQQKNRTNMTYEKLSRALRYYYRMNIIKKVQGKRLTYKFLQPPSCIQKGQRGAKPHGRLQASYGDVSPSRHDPSLSETRCPDYDSDANSLTDQSLEDGFDDEHKEGDSDLVSKGQGRQSSTSVIRDSGSPRNRFSGNSLPEDQDNRTQNGMSNCMDLAETYNPDISRLRLDRMSSSNPFHLTSSLYASSQAARYNLHYRNVTEHGGGGPTVYKPSPTYPIIGCSNLLDIPRVKEERFEVNAVPPAHSSSALHTGYSSHDNLKRSLSYDLSTLQVPRYSHRPLQSRSASPRKEMQNEPEDLSVKRLGADSIVKPELTDDVDDKIDDSVDQEPLVDRKPEVVVSDMAVT